MQRMGLTSFSTSAVSRPVVQLQGSLSSCTLTRAPPARGIRGCLASQQLHHNSLYSLPSRQLQHSTRAAAAVEQQQGSSDSLDAAAEPVAAPEAGNDTAGPPSSHVEAPAAAAGSEGCSEAGWSGFLGTLWQRGYFEEHSSGKEQ